MSSQASTGCPTIITVARFCASSVFGHPCWRLVHFSGSSHLRCWPFYSRVIVPTPGTRLTAALFHPAFDTTNCLSTIQTCLYITPHLHILPPFFFLLFLLISLFICAVFLHPFLSGVTATSGSPLPPHEGTRLHVYREKNSPPCSIIAWRRAVLINPPIQSNQYIHWAQPPHKEAILILRPHLSTEQQPRPPPFDLGVGSLERKCS